MNKEIKNIKKLIVNQSLELDCGKIIKNFPIAYETYGTLNKSKSNAINLLQILIQLPKKKDGGQLLLDLEKQSILINILLFV